MPWPLLKHVSSIFGWLGAALIFGAVVVRFVMPEGPRVWNGPAWVGLACLLLYTLTCWRQIIRMLSGRRVRYSSLSTASVLIVIVILGTVNYVGARQNRRWDLTANQTFTLSDETTSVLRGLTAPATFRVFAREEELDRFRSRLNEYEYVSKQVDVDYIDPDKKPVLAQQYNVEAYDTVLVEYQGRTERTTSDAEQDLTNALIKAVEGTRKNAYFIQGHGEKDPGSSERDGYNTIAAALGRDNFLVHRLVLQQEQAVPADTAVLIVAGPRVDLFPHEVEMLKPYLAKGGKMLFMFDPPATAQEPPLTNVFNLLLEWGIEVGHNVVVDVSGAGRLIGTDVSIPVAANYPPHPITERFNHLTAFPFARSVTPLPGGAPPARVAQTFIETSEKSWAEADVARFTSTGEVGLELAKGDKTGPISVGAVISAKVLDFVPQDPRSAPVDLKELRETRIAVIGDSDFASNAALGIQANRDLFLNTVNWLAQQENLVSIRPREPEDRRVTLTEDQHRRVLWLSIFIAPGLVLATGFRMWWRRR